MGNGSGKPPGMPKSAPKDLKEFVACKRPTVVVDTAKLDWVPTQGSGFGDIRVEPGGDPNTGTIILDGPLGADIELGASITNGELALDTSDIPDLFGPVKRRIDGWVKAFNDTMKRNNKKLESFSMRRGKITLTKAQVAAAEEPGAVIVPAGATEPASEPSEAPPGQAAEEDDSGFDWGCLTKIIGAGVLGIGAIGAYVGLTSGDGDDSEITTEQVADDASTQETETEEPAEEAAPVASPTPIPPTSVPSTPVPEISLFEPFDADVHDTIYPSNAQAWIVETEENLGEIQLVGDSRAEFAIRPDPSGPGGNVLGFTDTIERGALEVFSFGDSGQNGFTVLLPGSTTPNFGVVGDSSIVACPGGGFVFGGRVDELSESTGTTFYFDIDDSAFPPGAIGSSGTIFTDEPRPSRFAIDPDTGSILDIDAISQGFQDCLDDPEVQAGFSQFFGPDPASAGEGNAAGLAVLGPIFGDARPLLSDTAVGGRTFFFAPAPTGDTFDCESSDPISGAPGADITGVVGVLDGTSLQAHVLMAQPPTISEQGTSFAVSLEAVTVDNQVTSFLYEQHEGEFQIGRRNPDGTVDPADITLGEMSVDFNVELDSDAPALLFASGANIPNSGDSRGCDNALAFADGFPVPTDPTRFDIDVTGPSGGFTVESSPSDGVLFTSGDGDLLVRVLNTCELSGSFWVFAAASTDVEYMLNITDTATGDLKQYSNPLGGPAEPIYDTAAFATCP